MLKAAIIGCGRISHKHIEALLCNKEKMKLVATCDIKIDCAKEKALEYSKNSLNVVVPSFSDFREMIAIVKPDIVTIATESGKHHDIAVDCLEAGCNVICEKPMALSTWDADDMINVASKSGRKLSVCFQNRFNTPIRLARQAYEKGRFGKMLHGMVQVRWNRASQYYSEAAWRGTWALDGGTLMNQCTHGIDLLQWMMGEDVIRVHGVTRRFLRPIEAEDFGTAILEFKSGSVGIVEGSADIYPSNLNETLSLFGEKGSVVIGGLAVNRLQTWRFLDSVLVGDTEDKMVNLETNDPSSVYGFGHSALFSNFADAVITGSSPLIDGEAGRKALEIILAIYMSQKTGKPVDLPINFSTTDMEPMDLMPRFIHE